jgi:hypothetical protein
MEQSPQMFEGEEGPVSPGRVQEAVARQHDQQRARSGRSAEERGITVTDEEIDTQIEELKAGFPSEEEFNTALADANLTLDDLKQQLRDQLATQRLMEELVGDAEVTDEEIAAYYEENQAPFRGAGGCPRLTHPLRQG